MRDLLDQIRAAKLLTRFIARDQRAELVELKRQVEAICTQVDAFYELLGPRNWVYTDTFRTETIDDLLRLSVDDAEQALIAWYREPDTVRWGVKKFNSLPALRIRLHQIEQAREDYAAGRYYATVQTLLSVMDGFVNDVEPERRRGMHAREPDELQAWDSVVGHHMGLSHAHSTFTKTFRKTVTEEVFELYRHGIVHGMVLNFDNAIVATKAWNRLFAIADWAKSMEKAAASPPAERSWAEVVRDAVETFRGIEEQKRALAAWRPSSATPADDGFADDEVVARSVDYLAAWKQRNFGAAAMFLSPMVAGLAWSNGWTSSRGAVQPAAHGLHDRACRPLRRRRVRGRRHPHHQRRAL